MAKKSSKQPKATDAPMQPSWLKAASEDRPVRLSTGTRLEVDAVDRESNTIKGLSAISKGVALGHSAFIDEEMLSQIVAAGKETDKAGGLVSYYTHGSWFEDPLPNYLGRGKKWRLDGEKARTDLTIMPGAMPEKRDQILSIAETDPTAVGASIAFFRDWQAEQEFMSGHMVDKDGEQIFVSPDKANNPGNYPHWRLKALESVDIVAFPAANADGMFSESAPREKQIADAILGVVDGTISDGDLEKLGLNVAEFRNYVKDHIEAANLQILSDQEVTDMAAEKIEPKEETKTPESPKVEKVEAAAKTGADDQVAKLQKQFEEQAAELAAQRQANEVQATLLASERHERRLTECRGKVATDWASLSGGSVDEKAALLVALQDGKLTPEQTDQLCTILAAASTQLASGEILKDARPQGDGSKSPVIEEIERKAAELMAKPGNDKMTLSDSIGQVMRSDAELQRRYNEDIANVKNV